MDRLKRMTMQQVINKHWFKHKDKQKIIAIEELSELTKELTKDLRGIGDREKIIEEIADVYYTIEALIYIYEIYGGEILKYQHEKQLRTFNRIINGIEK